MVGWWWPWGPVEVGVITKDRSVLSAHLNWGAIRERHNVSRKEMKGDRVKAARVGDRLGRRGFGWHYDNLAFTWTWTVTWTRGPSIPASAVDMDIPEHSTNINPVTPSSRLG